MQSARSFESASRGKLRLRFSWAVIAALVALNGRHPAAAQQGSTPRAAKATGEAAFFRLPPPGGYVVTPDLVTLIVSLPEEAKLVYFDTVTNQELNRIELDFKPGAMALQGETLFVASQGGSSVYALDPKTAKVKAEFAMPGSSIANLACHPEHGLLYASTADLSVFSIDPADGSVAKTEATGTFLAVDPVNGKTVYAGAQPRELGGSLILKDVGGTIRLIWDDWGPRAAILKCAVRGKQLKVESIQDNAAVNGYQLQITPDGKGVMIIGGGGWRPPADGGTGGAYVTAVFKTDNLKSMSGQAPHGSGIAFHPTLNFGVTNQKGRALTIFNAKSLVAKKEYPVADGADMRSLILAFGGKGTKALLWNGANPMSKAEGLHFLPLELTKEDRGVLEKTYGKLPPVPERFAPATAVAASLPAAKPALLRDGAPERTTRKTTPTPAGRRALSRGKVVVSAVVGKGLASNLSLAVAHRGATYLTDRDYSIRKLPKEAEGGTLILRDTSDVERWLRPNSLSLTKNCVVYAAILTNWNDQPKVRGAQLVEVEKAGWRPVDAPFETTPPGSEFWEWKMFSKSAEAGELNLETSINLNTQLIFIIK